ncbi:hypothetical protein [Candidatus Leptofilum sp.]|uniref:hypothetical protein n=1 Tax=Candidatus Leptofilum sp. TaxID=3241576 RepID=UPI003B5A7E87
MQTKSLFPARQMPGYPARFVLGLLVLLLTLVLLVTAVLPIFDEQCEVAVQDKFEAFSAETAVPDCWLIH